MNTLEKTGHLVFSWAKTLALFHLGRTLLESLRAFSIRVPYFKEWSSGVLLLLSLGSFWRVKVSMEGVKKGIKSKAFELALLFLLAVKLFVPVFVGGSVSLLDRVFSNSTLPKPAVVEAIFGHRSDVGPELLNSKVRVLLIGTCQPASFVLDLAGDPQTWSTIGEKSLVVLYFRPLTKKALFWEVTNIGVWVTDWEVNLRTEWLLAPLNLGVAHFRQEKGQWSVRFFPSLEVWEEKGNDLVPRPLNVLSGRWNSGGLTVNEVWRKP